MANNTIQIKFDIDNRDLDIVSEKTLSLQKQIRLLKQELQKPGYSPQELQILSKKLGDLEDEFGRVRAKSGDLFTSLQLMPGPIGEIASKTNGAIALFKTFSGFKLDDLKFQLRETLDDFKDLGSWIGKTTGITAVFEKTAGALETVFTKFGMSADKAAKAARGWGAALTAVGIGAVVYGIYQLVDAYNSLNAEQEQTNALAEQTSQIAGKQIAALEMLDATIKNSTLTDRQKDEAVKQYNSTLGETLGKVENWMELEKKLIGKLPEYKAYLLKRAEAEATAMLITQAIQDKIKTEMADPASMAGFYDVWSEGGILGFFIEGREGIGKNIQGRALTAFDKTISGLQARLLTTQQELSQQQQALGLDKPEPPKPTTTTKKAGEDPVKKAEEEQKKLMALRLKEVNDKAKALLQGAEAEKQAQEKELQQRREFNKQRQELFISTITDERQRKREQLKLDEREEMAAMMRNTYYIKASAEEQAQIRFDIREKYRQKNKELTAEEQEEDRKTQEEDMMKQLQFLQLKGEGLVQGTKAYYKNRRDIIDETERIELQKLDDLYSKGLIKEQEYQDRKTQIEQNAIKARKANKGEELRATLSMISQTIDALGQLTGAIASQLDEEAKTSKDAFEKRKKLQVASAIMAGAASILAVFAAPPAGNVVVDAILKGVRALTVAISTGVQINKIKSTTFEGGGGGTEGQAPYKVTANRAQGGIVTGPGTSTSDSIPAMLSNGEYVVNARATRSFLPLLTAINDSGRRPRFAMGGLVQQNPSQLLTETLSRSLGEFSERPVKTYVVGTDMSNQQQFDRQIKSRSLM